MNPAASIIVFTTLSGAGYGLLFWLGLLRPLGLLPPGSGFALLALGLALALVTTGLVASTFHLGRPERAWRALSQWRTSWLSREGVAAIATYVPAGLLGLALLSGRDGLAALFGLLAAAGAAATVWCTGMLYASLKPVRQWHHPLVAPGYLLLAAFSGAVALAMLAGFAGPAPVPAGLAALLGLAALWLKRRYWAAIDAPPPAGTPTLESATGLGFIGRTRPLEPPHTEQNWLQREMAFRVARKHRNRLRPLVLLGFALPAALAALALVLGGLAGGLLLGLATLVLLAALLVERWLMFAEATHTVTLYYSEE